MRGHVSNICEYLKCFITPCCVVCFVHVEKRNSMRRMSSRHRSSEAGRSAGYGAKGESVEVSGERKAWGVSAPEKEVRPGGGGWDCCWPNAEGRARFKHCSFAKGLAVCCSGWREGRESGCTEEGRAGAGEVRG